jgi:hypothetical protein
MVIFNLIKAAAQIWAAAFMRLKITMKIKLKPI